MLTVSYSQVCVCDCVCVVVVECVYMRERLCMCMSVCDCECVCVCTSSCVYTNQQAHLKSTLLYAPPHHHPPPPIIHPTTQAPAHPITPPPNTPTGVALSGILAVLFTCFDLKATIGGKHPHLLYYLATAMRPRMLMTLDEEGKMAAVPVRVGQAVDVVAQAGMCCRGWLYGGDWWVGGGVE